MSEISPALPDRRLVCMFTGHRPQGLPFGTRETDARCIALKTRLSELIEEMITEHGVTAFFTGMALGVDTYAAEAVLSAKIAHPEVQLFAAVPCRDQATRWRTEDRLRYAALLARCDRRFLLQEVYTPDCMHKRNRFMADHAAFCIAVWSGAPGGTGSTVRYAEKSGVCVTVVDPRDF